MGSREQILQKLRAGKRPFPNLSTPDSYLPMSPATGDLRQRFIAEAEALQAIIHQPANSEEALDTLLTILGDSQRVICWDQEKLPLAGIDAALAQAGIQQTAVDDPQAEVGISGAEAALAATGSLVVSSGVGQARTASLLPRTHVALITASQILPHFEAWVAQTRQAGLDAFRQKSNIVIISGASRTADIAMQLILGMHGPETLHIILLNEK